MTKRERVELQGLVSPMPAVGRAVLFLIAVGAVALLLRAVQVGVSDSELPVWAVAAGLFGVALYVRAGRWTGGPELRNRIRADLAAGEMDVRRVRVVDALIAPEVEDEGPVIFVLDESSEVLFFAGQDIARSRRRGFPWTEFDVSMAPSSQKLFRVKAEGRAFGAVRERDPLSYDEAKRLGVLEKDFGTFAGEWDALTGGVE